MTGKIFVVGLGPGDLWEATPRALAALEASSVILGYRGYLELIRGRFPDKEFISGVMGQEVDRCRRTLELARQGRTVALVSSGDAGVYGMASLTLELAQDEDLEIEVVPGITACCSAAARLGAPLGHDFAVVSLSDLLTPWEVIQRRLEAAGAGDFVVCLYNPASRNRRDHLERACRILLNHRRGDTPAGWVRNAGRPGETQRITTLEEMALERVDMFTTVVIGCSTTRICRGRMVTPRGYPEGGL